MKKFFKDRDNLVILFVSLIAFIAGYLAIGPIKSLIFIGIIDCILFVPGLIKQVSSKEEKNKGVTKMKNEKKEKKKKKKITKIILFILLALLCFIIVACIGFAIYIVSSAPKFDPKKLYRDEPSTIYITNSNGEEELIATLGAEKRENITYDELAEVLVDAIIATEDSKFFQHNGFDLSRFLVASAKQVLTGGGGGASTLTMQIVKNNYTSKVSSGFEGIKRKFTDIYMAVFQVEKNYSKKEIIEFYVNSFYLGDGAYGVQQASHNYFGKEAKDLNLAEAALIAGLFNAPNAYDPYQHPDKAEQRRNQVLKLMKRHGYITDEEYKAAVAIKVEDMLVSDASTSNKSEWQPFIDLVIQDVIDNTKMSPYEVSMKIYATMDKDKQRWINDIMNGTTYTWQNPYVDAGIFVEDINTGAVVAIGAGRNRVGERQYITATQINKQIGSTSKPLYDYAPGIEYENWSTYTLFVDEPYTYSNGTTIYNWDRKYNGLMTLRTALAQSRNIPALKAFQANKNSNILKFVQSVGLHPEVSDGIIHEAHAIGGYTGESPRDMAAAYAVFGNGGYYIEPYSYSKIVIEETGETIEPNKEKTRVLSEETAYMMTSLLQSSAQTGLGNQYNIGGAIYGAKTGTSNYDANTIKRWGFGEDAVNDLWVNSVSPDYSISVWYGYKIRNEENKAYTSNSFTIAHRTLFQAVAKGIYKKGSNWTKPAGVSEVQVEMGSWPAALPSEYTPADQRVTELFKAGTEPTEVSSKYSKLPNVTNLSGSLSGNKITLKWTGVSVAGAYDQNYFNTLYKNDATRAAAMANNSFGSLIYEVYGKKDNGSLVKITDTGDTSVTFDADSNTPSTFVVKTTYTIFKSNASDGASVKVDTSSLKPKLSASFVDNKTTLTIPLNEAYTPSKSDVKVTADSKEVTANIVITITDKDNNVVSTIDTTQAGTYKVKYAITYSGQSTELTRTVIVQ